LLSKSVKIKICRTTILPVVVYGIETWSPAMRKGIRLRVLENSVLRRIFGPKRDEVRGEWRRLHNEELHALYSSPNWGTPWRSWFRHCAANRKVAGSILDLVTGIFQ
jgi:hypothetical protein